MDDFKIRRARRSDRTSIRKLVWRVGINPFGLRWQNFLVAVDSRGQLVGCGQLKPHGRKTVELASIAVERERRGHGVARVLIEALLERGPRPLYLICLPKMSGLYARFGFVAVSSGPLPHHFRRIRRMATVVRILHRARAPVVMRLG